MHVPYTEQTEEKKKHPNVHFTFISQCIPQNSWYAFEKHHKMFITNQFWCKPPPWFWAKKAGCRWNKMNIHGIPRYMKSSMKYHKIMMTVIMHGYKLFVNLSPQAHTSIPQAHTSIHTCICAHLVNKYESRQCQRISIYIFNTLKMMSVSLIRIVFRRK